MPTWNYTLVHASGHVRLVEDAARLREMVMRLVALHETPLGNPWDVRKAESVIDSELQGIVGFEIPVDRLEGKFKLNQNRSVADREGVIRALEKSIHADEHEVARLMREQIRDSGHNP